MSENRIYTVLRKEFLSRPENLCCNVRRPGCSGTNPHRLTVHHKRGRGKYYLDVSTWLSVCLSCHEWVETHPTEAKELGYSESRLANYN